MTTVAPPAPCPDCRRPLRPGAPACGHCQLPLVGPHAAELWQIDLELARLRTARPHVLAALRATAVPSSTGHGPLGDQARRRSGQQVLLGLGVVVLLVAAVVFVAVAWQLLGAAGQVLLMVAVTAGTVAAGAVADRRGLASTAEALSALAVGLAVVDVAAARTLGLADLDRLAPLPYAAAAAAAVAGPAAAASTLSVRLRTYPCAAVAFAAASGLLALSDVARGAGDGSAGLLVLAGALAVAAGWLRAARPVAATTAAVAAAGVGALSALAALAAVYDTGHPVDTGLATVTLTVLIGACTARCGAGRGPDTPGATATLAGLGAAALTGLLAAGLSSHAGPAAVTGCALAGALVVGLALTATGAPRARQAGRTGGYAVAVAAALVVTSRSDSEPRHGAVALLAVALASAALAWSRPAGRTPATGAAGAAALLAVAYATSAATTQAQAGALAATGLALAGAAAVRLRRPEEVALALTGVTGVAAAAAVAHDAHARPLLLALVLAAAALAAFGYALLPGRGPVALAGVGSASAATWILLADSGVDVVEAYTLPLAALLLAVGLVRLHRAPDTASWATVGPAASAALLPSAAVAAAQPTFLRAGLVLVAGAAVLVGGIAAHWQSPTVTGAAAVLTVTLAQLGPYAVGAPRWLTLGAVGVTLLAVGARYEQRREDLEQSARWLADLR